MDSPNDRRFPLVPFEWDRFAPFFGHTRKDAEVHLLVGGACNSNYRVVVGDQQFVCRIYSRGTPARELYLSELVRGAVPVPHYHWIGEGLSVMSFIEGHHFQPTPHLMREAGRVIGRLASIGFEQSGLIHAGGSIEPFDDWSSHSEGLMRLLQNEQAANYLDEPSRDQLSQILVEHSEMLASFDEDRNMVHGDFRPDNILISEDAIVGILDWEFAHSGSSFSDIGNILRHFSSEWEQDLAIGMEDEGIALPQDWRYRAYLMDLSSHLEFLTSQRSHAFKLECVRRIEDFMKLDQERKR